MSLYLPVFKALNEANVCYVVVGGLATVLHGYVRFTADIDLMIDLDHDEAEKCINELIKLGFESRLPVDPHQFSDASIRNQWIKEKNMVVFPLWKPDDPLLSVDLFIHNPIKFETLLQRAELVEISGQPIRIAAISDLIELKKLSKRPLDLEDIKQLQKILLNKAPK